VLEVAAMPSGSVQLVPPGSSFGEELGVCAHDHPDGECEVTYQVEEGQSKSVQLTAVPGPSQTFHRWSAPECGTTPVCTVELRPGTDRPEVWAIFSPARFTVLIAGEGTVTGANGTIDCSYASGQPEPGPDCSESSFAAGTALTLSAQGSGGAAVTWVFGCDPGDDSHASSCALRPENRYIGVRFGDADGPAVPFQVFVSLRVVKTGSGTGTVTGEVTSDVGGGDIDCGTTCVAKPPIDFGARVRLSAVAATGSHFVRWTGAPCSTQPSCVLNAGPVTAVGAVFDEDARPAPPPPPPTTTTTTTTAPPGTTTATRTTPPPPPRLRVRLLGVSWRRVGGRYRVLARVEATRATTARLRVHRGKRLIGQRTVASRQGRTTLWVALARPTRPGPGTLQIRFTDRDRRVVTVQRRVVVGR
jgi:hypothetical protein